MKIIGDSPKDWQRVVELVRLMPSSTAPEIAKLLGKPANVPLAHAMRKGLITRKRRKDRTKWFPNVGSWVYEVKADAQ